MCIFYMKCCQMELECFVIIFHQLRGDKMQSSGELDKERRNFLFRVCLLLHSCYCACAVGCTQGNFELAGLTSAVAWGSCREFPKLPGKHFSLALSLWLQLAWSDLTRVQGIDCVAEMALASRRCKHVT